jgi:hypothetical protein
MRSEGTPLTELLLACATSVHKAKTVSVCFILVAERMRLFFTLSCKTFVANGSNAGH